jgi:hypothetical protein
MAAINSGTLPRQFCAGRAKALPFFVGVGSFTTDPTSRSVLLLAGGAPAPRPPLPFLPKTKCWPKVSSFYGYGTFPPNPDVGVGYYVEAFVDGARSGYGVFATYIPIGEPPY